MTEIEPPVGEPLGFPKCPRCPYLRTGPPQLCLRCAQRSMERITIDACTVCSQMVFDGRCPNWLCNDAGRRITEDQRHRLPLWSAEKEDSRIQVRGQDGLAIKKKALSAPTKAGQARGHKIGER